MKPGYALLAIFLALLLGGCAAEAPVATTTPSRTPVPPSPTTAFRLIASWTPTPSSPPSATATPRPSATPDLTLQPLFTAQPNYTPASGVGLATPDVHTSLPWIDRFSFATDAQPFLLFELRYDPLAWQLETVFTPAGLGYQLAHRALRGCILSQTTGGNATEDMIVEYSDETLGGVAYYIGQATQADELAFVTYCTSYADTPTCFIAYPGGSELTCLSQVEGMLAGLTFLTNPLFTAAPNLWACHDEQNNPGLCQVSYTRPLNAISIPLEGRGWAAGEDGLILRQEGEDWQPVDSPAEGTLYDLAFLDETHGWAAGAGGTILRWDGEEWTTSFTYTPPEDDPSGAAWAIYALDFSLSDDGWAAGAIATAGGDVSPLLLHWNGLRWLPVDDLPTCQACGFNAVLALNSRELWLGGGSADGALLWHWDGTGWTGFPAPGATWIYALAQAPSGELWAAGLEQALTPAGAQLQRGALLRWDGSQWHPLSLLPQEGGIYALATLPDGSLVTGGDFTLLRSGARWSYIATEIAGYGWITDLATAPGGGLYALTSTGFLFELTH